MWISRVFVFGFAALVLGAAAPEPRVKVDRKPPEVTRKAFDPAKPPADLPRVKRGEEAVTVDWFSLHIDVDVQLRDWSRAETAKSTSRVTRVRVRTGLRVTIWVPERASDWLKEHEEGHRKISETFYEEAEAVAGEIGRAWVGRVIEGEGKDQQAATKAAIDGAIKQMADEYLARTQQRAQRVHELYDEITAHSRNRRVSVDDGIARALEREKQERPQQPQPGPK